CQVMRERYALSALDRVLQFAPITVDAALEQLLPGLICGATVVVRPDEQWSASELRRKIAALAITVMDVPPAYLHELLLDTELAADFKALESLRLVITGGEALSTQTLRLWQDSPLRDRRLVNAYGPTETTITSALCELAPSPDTSPMPPRVPVGRPLPGECIYILDR